MIEVYFRDILIKEDISLETLNDEIGFRVEGHSNLGTKGYDILCSAVSALAETAVVSLNKIAGVRQNIEQRKGFLKTTIFLNRDEIEQVNKAKIILASMIVGLEEIIKIYPDKIKIFYN